MQDLKEPKKEINKYQKAIYHDLCRTWQDLSQPIEYFLFFLFSLNSKYQ